MEFCKIVLCGDMDCEAAVGMSALYSFCCCPCMVVKLQVGCFIEC